ncbi:MAG: cell division protein ZapA [Candidatus Zixiibacteriota bacterium]
MAENKVVVNIFGEEYPITGAVNSEHIAKVADYVDSRMKEAAKVSRIQARDKVAILAAMSIASELLEKSVQLSSTEHNTDSILDGLLTRLDEALEGNSVAS